MAVTLGGGCWEGINLDEITLYVPKGTKGLYQATEGWNVFKNITEVFNVDGIHYTVTSPDEMTVEVTSGGSYEGDVVIPEKVEFGGNEFSVTSIGEEAFCGCRGLTSIVIPEGVTSIGGYAFKFCSGLTSFAIPESVTSIGDDAFSECSGLTSITIPKGVNRIGDYAFWDCCGLTSIVVDAGNTAYTSANGSNTIIEKASNKLIVGCSITVIPEGVTNIAGGAFYNCSGLTSITIPKGVTSICHHAFEGCSGLTSITIPESVTNIGEQAFYRCSGLTSITIHKGLTNIDNWGFADCSGLTSVTIPNSVTNIGDGAFASCHRLKSVIFLNPTPGNFPETIGLDDDCIVYVPKGSKAAYEAVFPQYIIVEEGEIFTPIFTAKTVEGVDMTFKVISEREKTCMVGDEKGEHVHSFPTDYNGGITIPSTANGYKVTRIGSWAFNWCGGLTSVNIPETVTSIGYQAFIGTSIREIDLPNSLERIEDFAFQCCYNLISIFIPKNVTSIGYGSFEGCLNSMVVDSDNPVYDSRDNCNAIIKTATNELIKGCKNTIIPKTVTKIGILCFSHCGNGFTSIVIPESITSIDHRAFLDNSDNLTEILSMIKEPMTVTLGGGCWEGINLDEITLYVPKGTKGLYQATEGWNVFKNITEVFNVDGIHYTVTSPDEMTVEVTSGGSYEGDVVIPEKVEFGGNEFSVTSIGCGAFQYCTNLTSISIPFGVTKIDDVAFQGCFSLTSITIPESVTNIGCFAFEYCFDLTNIIIPNSVANIGEGAFAHCPGPTSINIPEGLTRIGINEIRNPFYGCSGLMSIVVDEGNTVYTSANGANVIIEKESNLLITGCKNTIIPDGVTRIGRYAFADCPDLTSITIPEGVISIDDRAFSDCSGLTSFTIPNSVTSIGGAAFAVCTGLTSITIPNSVTSIGGIAFEDCSGLTEVLSMIREPFAINTDCWDGVPTAEIPLYVPKGTKQLYKATEGWSVFKNIIEKDDAFFVDNAVYINDTLARQGRKMTLSLKMKNTAAIRGFQFDLYLPEGVTVAKNSKGKILGALSAGRLPDEDEHTLSLSEQADGAIRFLCSSQYDETFTGNDGEIATLQVNIADGMADGDYLVQLKNMKLTESDIDKYYETDLLRSYLNVNLYVIGDINRDKKVDISDYTGVANHIHGNTPQNFFVNAADVDEDGIIDVSDYTGIANIIHTGNIYGISGSREMSRSPKKENTDVSSNDNVIYVEPFAVTPGTQTTISFKMKNTAEIRGFQFDLYLPEGVTVVKSPKGRIQGALIAGRLPEDDEHDLTFSEQADGAIRFLCSSLYDETFTGNDGEIATLQVNVAENMADGNYPVVMKHVKLTETDISKFYLTEEVETTVSVLSTAEVLKGDVTGDGNVNAADVTALVNYILGKGTLVNEPAADVNGDTKNDIQDVTALIGIIKKM